MLTALRRRVELWGGAARGGLLRGGVEAGRRASFPPPLSLPVEAGLPLPRQAVGAAPGRRWAHTTSGGTARPLPRHIWRTGRHTGR